MSSERPVTSKSRGICRYYNTSRGCYSGNNCKFLHGESETLTPYDRNKTCKFYAAGYCRRGDQCWFQHVIPSAFAGQPEVAVALPATEEEDHLCCICYEKPVTYGLLGGCSHIFCVQCIREWRNPNGKSEDVVSSGVTKQCPLCRASSRFVTPSSQFFPEGHPGKAAIIDQYKASMARVPCRHFHRSSPDDRFCPFGTDCFYQHLNADGTPHVFEHGVDHNTRMYQRRLRERSIAHNFLGSIFDDLGAALDAIRATFTDFGLTVEDDDYSDIRFNDGDEAGEGVDGEMSNQDAPLAETMDMLVEILNNVHADEVGGRTVYRFGTATPLTAGDDPAAIAPLPPLEVPLTTLRPVSPALPVSMPEENIDVEALTSRPRSSASRAISDSHSRFSTVVHRTGHAATDRFSRSLDDLRQLPDGAVVPAVEDERAYHVARNTHVARRVSDDERITREAEALLHDAEDLNRRVLEVLRPETLNSGDNQPAPSASTAEPVREETRSPPPPPPPEVVHDADPPFLTDGRGRVVWSSTTAGRHHRESRRGRSGASAAAATQHKMRREVSDTDVAARAVESSAQGDMGHERTSSRARHPPRALSDPEDIRSCSIDHDGPRTFVSGCRAVTGDVSSSGTPEIVHVSEQSVHAVENAIDEHSEQSGSEGSGSGRDSEGRSLLGRIFGAVLAL